MPIVGALLLLAVDRDLGAVRIEHHPPAWRDGLRPGEQLPIERGQTGKVLGPRQHFGLERLRTRGQGRVALQDLRGADQPEGRVLGKPLGIVDILVSRQAAVHRLPHQVGQRQLGVLCARVGQVPLDEIPQTQSLVQLPHQQQAAVGSHPRALELNPQGAVERELKGTFLRLNPLPLYLLATPSASNPASIRAFQPSYQIASPLRKRKSRIKRMRRS